MMWEYEGISHSDCVMFWIPRTEELIGLTTIVEQDTFTEFKKEVDAATMIFL